MTAVTICSDFEVQENKMCHCFHFSPPSICHEVMERAAMMLVFLMLSINLAFSLSLSLESEWVSEVAQSCPTLCNPMDCSLPGSSLHGSLQARVLEWAAISFSRGSSWPRDRTWVSRIPGRHFNLWATREAHWRREWQTIPVFLLQEPNEQYEKVKR